LTAPNKIILDEALHTFIQIIHDISDLGNLLEQSVFSAFLTFNQLKNVAFCGSIRGAVGGYA